MMMRGQRPHPATDKMMELAVAVADERALGAEAPIAACSQALKEVAGEHALVDTACIIALFSAMTIVVDLSGHKHPPQMKTVFMVIEKLAAVRQGWPGFLPVMAVAALVAGLSWRYLGA